MIFRLGELFCGPGGLAWGARMAGTVRGADGEEFSIRHAWATDYDEATCRTYGFNICGNERAESVVCADVRKLDLRVLKGISEIDGLAFGFPCNDFSQVGEQKGVNGTFGPLYQYGVRMLELCQPMWFLAENVGGLQSANEGRAFNTILRALFEAGYDLYPNFYFFEKYGVPQARHRVIIVGIRKDLGLEFGIPSTEPFRDVDVSCRTAIEQPPIAPDALNNEPTRQSRAVVERLQYIQPGENAFTAHLPPHLQLQIQGARISQFYKRLGPDRPAYTVTGSGGGGTHMYHWAECRARASRKRGIFSNDWKHFFQSLEKCRKIFPIVGKNGRNFPTIGKFFSNHWKTSRRARVAA